MLGFIKNTQVLMGDGTYKNIQDIVKDEYVMSYDEETKTYKPQIVVNTIVNRCDGFNEYIFSDGTDVVGCTDLLFLTTSGEYNVIEEGDEVVARTESGSAILLSKKVVNGSEDLYDLDVEDIDNFIVGNIIVHNASYALNVPVCIKLGTTTGNNTYYIFYSTSPTSTKVAAKSTESVTSSSSASQASLSTTARYYWVLMSTSTSGGSVSNQRYYWLSTNSSTYTTPSTSSYLFDTSGLSYSSSSKMIRDTLNIETPYAFMLDRFATAPTSTGTLITAQSSLTITLSYFVTLSNIKFNLVSSSVWPSTTLYVWRSYYFSTNAYECIGAYSSSLTDTVLYRKNSASTVYYKLSTSFTAYSGYAPTDVFIKSATQSDSTFGTISKVDNATIEGILGYSTAASGFTINEVLQYPFTASVSYGEGISSVYCSNSSSGTYSLISNGGSISTTSSSFDIYWYANAATHYTYTATTSSSPADLYQVSPDQTPVINPVATPENDTIKSYTITGGTVLWSKSSSSSGSQILSNVPYNSTIYWTITANTGYNLPSKSSGSIIVNESNFSFSGTSATYIGSDIKDCTAIEYNIVCYDRYGTSSSYTSLGTRKEIKYYGDTYSYEDFGTTNTYDTAAYTYTYTSGSGSGTVSGNTSVSNYFSRTTNEYSITLASVNGYWKDGNGNTITSTAEKYKYGAGISIFIERSSSSYYIYVNSLTKYYFVAKDPTVSYNYTISDITKSTTTVSENTTVTGTATEEDRLYTIEWLGYDGSVIDTTEDAKVGDYYTYSGSSNPEKPSDLKYNYAFSKWALGSTSGTQITPGYSKVAGSKVSTTLKIYSVFTSTLITYTVAASAFKANCTVSKDGTTYSSTISANYEDAIYYKVTPLEYYYYLNTTYTNNNPYIDGPVNVISDYFDISGTDAILYLDECLPFTYDIQEKTIIGGTVTWSTSASGTYTATLTGIAYNTVVYWKITPNTGYDAPSVSAGSMTVDDTNFNFSSKYSSGTASYSGSAIQPCTIKTFTVTFNGPTYGNWDYTSLEVEYGDRLYIRYNGSNYYWYCIKHDDGSSIRWTNNVIALSDTDEYHYTLVSTFSGDTDANPITTDRIITASNTREIRVYPVAPELNTGLVYNGSAQNLCKAGTTEHGTYYYYLYHSSSSTNIPTGTNAGDYIIYWYFTADSGYYGSTEGALAGTVTIAKAPVTPVAPALKTGLIYTSTGQELCSAGTSSGGTYYYGLTSSSCTSTTIPTGTNATTYTVYWKWTADDNHSGSTDAASAGTVIISSRTVTVDIVAKSKTYGDSDPTLQYTYRSTTRDSGTTDVTTGYGTDTMCVTLSRASGESYGSYNITGTATFSANGTYTNYVLATSGGDNAFSINKRTVTVTAPTAKSATITYIESTYQDLFNTGSCTTGGIMYYYITDISTAPEWSIGKWKKTPSAQCYVNQNDSNHRYYLWYYCYVSDTTNYTGDSINTILPTSATIYKAINKCAQVAEIVANSETIYYSTSTALVVVNQRPIDTYSPDYVNIYYAVNTQLTASNYLTAGSTTIPTASSRAAGNYTVYYYVPECDNRLEQSGGVSVTINKAPLKSIDSPDSSEYSGIAQTPTPNVYSIWTVAIGSSVYTLSYQNNLNAGTATVTATANSDSNFTGSVSTTWTITKANITVTAKDESKTYDGTALTASNTATASTAKGGDAITVTCSGSQLNVGSSTKTLDTVTITRNGTDVTTSCYGTITKVNGTLIINKQPITVTAPTAKTSLKYTGSAQALATAGSTTGQIGSESAGTFTYSLDNSTYSTSIPTKTNAGDYTVYWKFTIGSNYSTTNSTSGSFTVNIARVPATLPTSWAGDSKYYHDTSGNVQTAVLTCSGYSGGTIYYASSTTSSTSGFGSWTTTAPTRPGTEGVGNTYVKCYISGDDNHDSSDESSVVSLTINANSDAAMTVTVGSTSTYNGTAKVIASASNIHGVSEYWIGYSLTSSTSSSSVTWADANTTPIYGTNANTYYIWYKFNCDAYHSNSKDPTYVGSVTISPLTATLSWGDLSWTYDGKSHSTTCTISNLQKQGSTTDTCTVTLSNNSVGPNVGTATVTATALSNSNYALPSDVSKTLSITQKANTITLDTSGDITFTSANSATVKVPSQSNSLIYNGDVQTPTWSPTTYASVSGGTSSATDANTYSQTASLNNTDYFKSSTATRSASANENPKFTWSSSNTNVVTVSPSSTESGANCTLTYVSAGSAVITITSEATTNYSAASISINVTCVNGKYIWEDNTTASKSVSWTIGQRPITFSVPTAVSTNLTYDGTAKTLFNAGSSTAGGTMYYYITNTTTKPTWSTSTWTTDISTETTAGTYYLWYYCYVSDTDNNTGTNINTILPSSATLYKTIAKATNTITLSGTGGTGNITYTSADSKSVATPTQSNTLKYTGKSQSPTWNSTTYANVSGGTSSAIKATSYSQTASLKGTAYFASSSGTKTATIGHESPSITWSSNNSAVAAVSPITTSSGSACTITYKSAGTATITVSAAETTNYNAISTTFTVTCNNGKYIWSDGTTASKTVAWSIGPTSYIYNGTSWTPVKAIWMWDGTQWVYVCHHIINN